MILGGFVWISWIPGGYGVPGLIFHGVSCFGWVRGGYVSVSWMPGARGRAAWGDVWQLVAGSGDRVWTLSVVWSDQWLDDFDDFDDSMT